MGRFRDDLLDGIEKHNGKPRKVFFYVVFIPALDWTLVPVLCLSGLYWLVTTHGSFIGMGLLDAAQWWANVLDFRVLEPYGSYKVS